MIARIRRIALSPVAIAAVLAAAVLGATPLDAQQAPATAGTGIEEHRPAVAGPTIERAAVGVRPQSRKAATLEDTEAAMQRLGLGQARALMIVGFAAVVIGLLMDNDPGTLIAVGGAVVGLYGLYHYLR